MNIRISSFIIHLYICSLFNNSVSNFGYTEPNDWTVVNNQLEKMRIQAGYKKVKGNIFPVQYVESLMVARG
jgi:hypothetical protein